jgi:outer membrane lipoprotein SlyB
MHDSGMKTNLAAVVLASALLVPLTFSSGTAQAQQSAASAATPRIDGFDVDPAAQLSAGNELTFTLYGSPAGTASVRIGGSTASLGLPEVEAGVYEGTYTIARRDRLTAESTATANLRLGNRVATSILDESLLAGAAARWPGGSANGVPRIDRFHVDAPARLAPGEQLVFTLAGTQGGAASVRINGVRGKIALEEVRAGTYEGAYTVRNRDQIASDTVVTGNLRVGRQERTMVLAQSLVETSARPQGQGRQNYRRTAAPAPVAPVCANCGTVESINAVQVKGDGSYLGMIAGGIAGAVVGSQVGHGDGTTIAQVLGAAGGGYAGNEIEKRMKTSTHYDVVVRLENGATQTISYPAQPTLHVGSRVRLENGALVAI